MAQDVRKEESRETPGGTFWGARQEETSSESAPRPAASRPEEASAAKAAFERPVEAPAVPSRPRPQPTSQPPSKPASQPTAEPQPASKSLSQPPSQPKPAAESQPVPRPEPQSKPQPTPQPKPKAERRQNVVPGPSSPFVHKPASVSVEESGASAVRQMAQRATEARGNDEESEDAPHVSFAARVSHAFQTLTHKERLVAAMKAHPARAGALIAVLVIYLAGSLFFSLHFLPGTRINRRDVSWQGAGAVARHTEKLAQDYTLHVRGDNLDFTVEGTAIDLVFDEAAFKRAAAARYAGLAWPLALLRQRDFSVTAGVSYDAQALQGLVASRVEAVDEEATLPVNATVRYDAQSDLFEVLAEVPGTYVDEERARSSVADAVATVQHELELGESELLPPAVTTAHPHFDEALRQADDLRHKIPTFTIEGEQVPNVDEATFASWLTIDDECEVAGNLELITEWAQGPFSAHYDTVGTMRTYERADDGKQIEVAGGTYGWNVDGKAFAQRICDYIATGEAGNVEVPLQSAGAVLVQGGQDWGSHYVDVDLSEQLVRLFDGNGELVWYSECVTGNMSEGRDTVTGVYAIEGKESPAVLIGLDEDMDGEPDYESDVDYWMPFYGGYGLHDALWRDYFGSDAFVTNGSHGCVNLPYYEAQELYGLIEVGDPVVVHW